MFGGHRKWFASPGCQRPTRILYGVNSLQCRRCRGLRCASQSEASHWRAQRKAVSIRHRLGASGEALDGPFPPKPPKMRWATYKRLQALEGALQKQWLLGAAGDVARLRSRVKGVDWVAIARTFVTPKKLSVRSRRTSSARTRRRWRIARTSPAPARARTCPARWLSFRRASDLLNAVILDDT